MARLTVLASGIGSILESIIASELPVELVLADRPCRALDVAEAHGIAARLINRAAYGYVLDQDWDRAGYTAAVMRELRSHDIDLVAMAGFMTIFGPEIFIGYEDRILNTHPSLLPKFKGAHAVELALADGATETGCTVHIATAELDSGRILTQQRVPILPGDTTETLQERIKAVERKLYPATIRTYLGEI